jgi:diguanylate cyclase (GGDEF)-like protein
MLSLNRQRFAEVLHGIRQHWIFGLLQRPFHSLPSRIIVSVFATALVTSLVVTWVSTHTIESFLRAKIDQRFPALLRSTSDRLELWYSHRELDVATFARSHTVVDNLRRIDRDEGGARDELARYLSYVLERFPQYASLFLLDAEGEPVLEVGERSPLSEAHRRHLAAVSEARVGPTFVLGGRRVQFASAVVTDASGRPLASLHAQVRTSAVEAALLSEDLGRGSGIYVVNPEHEVLIRSPGAPRRERPGRPLPEPHGSPSVHEYTHEDGAHVVGSAVSFPRFGWIVVLEQSYDEAFAPLVAVIREILGINLGIVALFGLVAFHVARSIVRPILALSEAALRIATGESDVMIPGPPPNDEIGVLTRAFNEMSRRLQDNQRELEENRIEIEETNSRLVVQNEELQRVNEVFQQLSITDDLTKLHNHRFFQEHLPREMKRSKRTGEPLCLILMDIDDFKELNDRFGHSVGDAVLRKVADVMNQSVRDMDLLARYGGEEFVLLASQTALEGAVALAEKTRLAIARARFSLVDLDGPQQISVTASFGVTQYRGDDRAFFNDADRALYRAKASGKDCVATADEEV